MLLIRLSSLIYDNKDMLVCTEVLTLVKSCFTKFWKEYSCKYPQD